ncbi:MAG: hypothetical protein ACE5EG_05585 [Thermoanaerobaculia bacterium]
MEEAVQLLAVVNFTVIGLSHILQPSAWVQFFAVLRDRGEAGVFAVAFLSLIFGSIIVAFHNVWSGIPMVLTIVGWLQVLKALIYFLFPAFGLRKLHIPSHERPQLLVYPGIGFLVLAGLLGYHLLTA